MSKVFTTPEELCQTWLDSFNSGLTIESKKLTIHSKGVESINPNIFVMKNLISISFYNNKISELPEQLCELTQLESLYLDKNKIVSDGVPENIGNLTNLTNLSLSINKLTALPESFGNLISLTELFIYNNDFSMGLPDSFSRLTNLEKLHLQESNLNEFPIQLFNLKSLNYLNMRENDINEIPEDISQLSSLTDLLLENNPISDFSPLKPLTNLKHLKLTLNNKNTSKDCRDIAQFLGNL
eukprot:TRINITY_DN4793_c0_g2_i5.p1 TRINITY_DN4793_c0_g2~~TRINITY_DN4793_c0_g2_i5.p1  ORF type:complete len:240 (+),score=47.26 TRINITY_DN4793_c0_g2_i5:147-866(+)